MCHPEPIMGGAGEDVRPVEQVTISSGSEVGYLFFRGGQIVHAVSRRGIGETAALEILRWDDGSFEPCSAGWPDRDSIGSNWQNLLLLAAQHKDESSRRNLVAFPGSRSSVPRPSFSPAPDTAKRKCAGRSSRQATWT